MTSGMMKVVSITKRTEIPSTPILYCRPSSQSRSSTNWKPVFRGSNCARMKSETRKVATVAISASHLALRSAASSSPRRKSAEDQRRECREERGDGQKVVHYFAPPVSVIQVTRTAIPITMAKA